MKVHKWQDIAKRRFSPEKLAELAARADAAVLEMTVQELRKQLGLTQEQVAKIAEMTQGELSRAEARDDHLVSTLRRIVKALGGELRVTAVFGKGKEVVLEDA